jgi:hypothetical protein
MDNKKLISKIENNKEIIYSNIPYQYKSSNNIGNDVLLNPYVPPTNDETYFLPMPINIPTSRNVSDGPYRQIGILSPLNGQKKDNILPLMGRMIYPSRSLYQYYTISNQHNNVKLPIMVKGKSGLNDNGVNEIYSGDNVYVEGINEVYKANIYENDTIRYLPTL